MGEIRSIQIAGNPLLTSISDIAGVNLSPNNALGLNISDCAFSNLDPLSSITNAPETINIEDTNLSNISGLSNMQGEVNDITIANNHSLINLNGLNGISIVQGDFFIYNNSLQNLTGLENIINPNGLSFVGLVVFDNDQLVDISAISNLNVNGFTSIAFINNLSLSACSNQLVCDAISQNKAVIESNAQGCNTLMEVQQDCTLGISEETLPDYISIHPNPVENKLFISSSLHTLENYSVKIFSSAGKLLLESSLDEIDVSPLSSGLYFIQIKTPEKTYSIKFIKK